MARKWKEILSGKGAHRKERSDAAFLSPLSPKAPFSYRFPPPPVNLFLGMFIPFLMCNWWNDGNTKVFTTPSPPHLFDASYARQICVKLRGLKLEKKFHWNLKKKLFSLPVIIWYHDKHVEAIVNDLKEKKVWLFSIWSPIMTRNSRNCAWSLRFSSCPRMISDQGTEHKATTWQQKHLP